MLKRVEFEHGSGRNAPSTIAVMIGQLGQGGSERQLFEFLAHCDATLWRPVLYVSGELGPWEERIRALGVTIVLLTGNRASKLLQFRKDCIKRNVRCFFSWSSYTNGFALALSGLAIPCIGSFRNALFADLPERFRWLWAWTSLARLTAVVCNSKGAAIAVTARCGDRLNVVFAPNQVSLYALDDIAAWRSEWRDKLGLDDKALLIVGVGRLAPQKNFARFIDVIAKLKTELPVRAVIAGDDFGSLSALNERVANAGLTNKVAFLGRVPDAHKLIAAADIFLLTSDFEGTPNVVLEAMSAHVACVSTRVDGVCEILSDGQTGLLADCDASDLARRIDRLADDPPLRARIATDARRAIEAWPNRNEVAQLLWRLCSNPEEKAKQCV